MSTFAGLALQAGPPKPTVNVGIQGTGSLFSNEDGEDTFLQIDGDTWAGTDGTRYRLQGAYAPEIGRVAPGRERLISGAQGVDVQEGEAFGESTNRAIQSVVQSGGFNKVVKTGETDAYGREIVRFTNERGEDLTQALYRSGILKPTAETADQYLEAYEQGEVARSMGIDTGYTEIMGQLDEDIQSQLIRTGTGLQMYGMDAIDEADYAGIREASGLHNLVTDIAFDDPNRDKNNMANSSIGASAYTGWLGMKEGFYGAAEMLGAEDLGGAGLERLRQERGDLALIDNISIDQVDGIGDFLSYLGNNAAMSAPYLALLAGGSLLGPVGAAAAVGATGTVYSGQIWNEMEGEKNAGAALAGGFAAAMVDRLGLAGIIKPSSMLTKAGINTAAQHLVNTGKYASVEAAKAAMARIGRKEAQGMLREMSQNAGIQAGSLVNRGNLLKNIAVGGARGAAVEGLTEATQESIQYATAAVASDKEFNQWELEDRIRDALAAGTTLGGAFGVGGELYTYGDRLALERDWMAADERYNNSIENIREGLRKSGEFIESTTGIREKYRAEAAKWAQKQDKLREAEVAAKEAGKRYKGPRTDRGAATRAADSYVKNQKGFINTLKEIDSVPQAIVAGLSGVGKLVQAASTTAFDVNLLAQSAVLRDMRSLIGQTRGVIHSGRSFEGEIDQIYGSLAKQIYKPEVFARFGTKETGKNRERISQLLRQYGKDGWYDRMVNGESIADAPAEIQQQAQALFQTAREMEKLADNIHKVQNSALKKNGEAPLSYTQGWWWKHQDFDPAKVQKNRKQWYDFMREHTELTPAELDDFYDRIVGGDASTTEDYFSHVRGIDYQPGHHKQRSAKLSEQTGYEMFSRDDMFAMFDSASRSAARFSALRDFFGPGGQNLDFMIDSLREEGILTEKEIEKVAWYSKTIIDAATGNYNRITNPRWAAVQKFSTFISTIAGLPLSALSSIPESAMNTLGLDSHEVARAVSKVAQEITKAFGESIGRVGKDMITSGQLKPIDASKLSDEKGSISQRRLDEAGLYWEQGSAAKKLGVGETNVVYSWMTEKFFRTIGLTQLTQGQRRAAASITTDFVAERLAVLAGAGDLKDLTNYEQQKYNQLAELGMEVDAMVEIWKSWAQDKQNAASLDYVGENRGIPEDVMGIIDKNMQDAVYNFTNMRIQNPQSANRPLFFQDPHYQLLTQFNGFISTFTANVVPKLWNDYLRKGTPRVKYNTFALMVGMMALGATSQYLKDMIKYGKSSPYLSDPQLLQRAIYSSGVLGQAERAVDIVLPLYGSRPRSDIDWFLDTLIGESGPTVRNIGILGTGLGALAEGEGQRAVETGLKLTPVNPFNRIRKGLANTLVGEDFFDGWTHYAEIENR